MQTKEFRELRAIERQAELVIGGLLAVATWKSLAEAVRYIPSTFLTHNMPSEKCSMILDSLLRQSRTKTKLDVRDLVLNGCKGKYGEYHVMELIENAEGYSLPNDVIDLRWMLEL